MTRNKMLRDKVMIILIFFIFRDLSYNPVRELQDGVFHELNLVLEL